ncbi:hypothetical protein BBJ28_00015643 [Nothophytophthora sp. Chile5]|nr:hypothetical protein BBJ28_00015643 [Nothophytophthora sp. Chile5]
MHRCNICDQPRKQAPRTGYSNLLAHLNAKHPTHGEEYTEFQRRNLSPLDVFGFVDQDTSSMYDCLRWIVERNMPLSEVESPLTRQLVKMRPTTPATVKSYMRRVAERVGNAIAVEMGSVVSLMFDGWTHSSHHFVAIFAVHDGSDGRQERLIGLSPMEHGLTADALIECLNAVLGVYNKDTSVCKYLVGDNCSTNQSMATKLGVPLVGCASHRFNLAMGVFLESSTDLISQIQNLMIHLRIPNIAAELARHTEYAAIRSNTTRWSSVWEMVRRYVKIRDAIMKVAAVEDLVPRGAAQRRILVLDDKLEKLDSVCKKLQYAKRTMVEVRALFDACIEKYPIMAEHLSAGADIVQSPGFETAVVKMTTLVPLMATELKALEPFRQTEPRQQQTPNDGPMDFATEIPRRSKKPRRSERGLSNYIPLMATIPPTSNRCERLFSECKYVLTPHRSSMQPANFKMIMFLKANCDLVTAATLLPYIIQ